ncbi:signal recognition particle-docking protein FtsY [Roseateles sp. 22389]|uniref:signal recognition particle-docking protein FtsY n=1 Tax=Roseateles sp. 22389 TaxID=3453916 RepID=UPI002637A7E6|nr:signal recognition particle-docking protein FtsY [uncultured Roseateles sp.]
MFSFLKKKLGFGSSEPTPAPAPEAVPAPPPAIPAPPVAVEPVSAPAPQAPSPAPEIAPVLAPPSTTAPAPVPNPSPNASVAAPSTVVAPAPVASPPVVHAPAPAPVVAVPTPVPATVPVAAAAPVAEPEPEPAPRKSWMDKLRQGLRKTGSSIAQVFTGTQIDDALYEELEAALLMADAGVKATEFLLEDLKRRVKDAKATEPAVVRQLLVDALTELLQPLQRQLVIGEQSPMVMMVVGVNGAGKTTSIGKLTRHLADAEANVLLAAADTFRAAAREQLAVWADRNRVQIVSQEGGDPSAVTYDAVVAGKARGCDVVIADTAGRLPTQLHLMEELKKIKRVIGKAQETAPHEVLLVVDGNTGQNALTQVKAFDDALGLTGLIVTKLDGTAKGGVLAAIARERPIPVYFIGVGEKLEDLQTFDAREFAQALLE